MAKARKKSKTNQSEYLKRWDGDLLVLAIPRRLVRNMDVVRDALVEYAPGDHKGDFAVIRMAIDWVDHMDEIVCKPTA